jgi:hypothetical protein
MFIYKLFQGKSSVGGPKALLTGWGKISDGGTWSRFLRKVRISIVPDEECYANVEILGLCIPKISYEKNT